MPEPKTISAYLETVAAQIRWRRARPVVTAELARHLEDQREAFAAEGREHAEALAVEEMGDPVSVGRALDCVHRPKPQTGLLLLTVLLALAGGMLRIGLTADWAPYDKDLDPSRTMLALILGIGALLLGYFMDYTRMACHAKKIYAGALVLSVLALYVSPKVNGVFYYARYVTLFYPVVYAFWLHTCRRKGWAGLVLALLGGIPLGLLCMCIPHTFGLLMLLLTGLVLLVLAAWNDWFAVGRRNALWAVVLCAAALGAVLLHRLSVSEYAVQRLTLALHPELDPIGRGYPAMAVKRVLSASQWLGTGTGGEALSSRPYELSVPGCESDAFLTTLIYKLGWLPFLALLLSFAGLFLWLLLRCLRNQSQLGRCVALAVILPLCLQALCSAAWSLGFQLFSSAFPLLTGNANTVLTMWLIGLALSVFREERIAQNRMFQEAPLLPRYRVKLVVEKIR